MDIIEVCELQIVFSCSSTCSCICREALDLENSGCWREQTHMDSLFYEPVSMKTVGGTAAKWPYMHVLL